MHKGKSRYNYYGKNYPGDFIDTGSRELQKGIKRRFGRSTEWLLVALLTFFLIFFFKKQSVFLLFAGIAGYVKYLQTKWGSPVDVSPLFFFTVVIGSIYGILGAFFFIIIADFIPFLLGGGILTFVGFPTYGLYLVLAWFGSFSPANLVYVGVVLSVLNTLGTMIINKLCGSFQSLIFFNIVLHMFLNFFYFLKLAPFIIAMIQ
ncbi:hypothetical protein COV93_07435 [Candidatus Woesearchaeota archaeon CG11_big_fil_rev_8_21_14_0_20_43_8]|nr:MAG: hypothetical protein COV93_07435 [Candidatus Woesearchaeota archaeon CG11_big_fil_rev_8_21_14_0_20_43_8]PIO06816.1 MAG: hypothetical protein COT47_02635 [Candidatus Woesearchaeota archaeon CG08_land_8_20_14_0_20_43_7]